MAWDHITKGWDLLATKFTSLLSPASEPESKAESPIRAAISEAEDFIRESPTPYTPDTRHDRSDSSLHLSC